METIRIAMWSGPRNISTAMMRAFENRPDAEVSDEPFYAAYLARTGLQHPMRDAILASQPRDWRQVAKSLLGAPPLDRPIWYQKHMTHHMVDGFGLDWADGLNNVFLIRAPEAVLASYVEKRAEVNLDDIGLPRQVELFDRAADRLGVPPPVIESNDVLADPRAMLTRLCTLCAIPFREEMLGWPAGRRASDGVWASAWYDKVEQSTGFAPARREVAFADLPDDLKPIAAAARPLYERLSRYRLTATS
jgi:hypothetical protein